MGGCFFLLYITFLYIHFSRYTAAVRYENVLPNHCFFVCCCCRFSSASISGGIHSINHCMVLVRFPVSPVPYIHKVGNPPGKLFISTFSELW